jgi:hypothetical protein
LSEQAEFGVGDALRIWLIAALICGAVAVAAYTHGMMTGRREGRGSGLKDGYNSGYADGKAAGKIEGYRAGTKDQFDLESKWEDMNFDAKLQSRLDTNGAQVSWSEKDGIWHVHCPVKR